MPTSIDEMEALLHTHQYVADRSIATSAFLAMQLRRPLMLEGEAGVGKTELARVLAAGLGRRLERLQCYAGIELAEAAYEWNHQAQMIEIRLAEAAGQTDRASLAKDIFSERFLLSRPLLRALTDQEGGAPVLLIDELDRADEPFEAYLLELLADYQITIPELGPIRGKQPPIVIITSNRTREIHDAIRRRCLYGWIDYPSLERERSILALKAPDAPAQLRNEISAFVRALRDMDLFKPPGIAETIDWAHALVQLDAVALQPHQVGDTLGVILKYQDDIARMQDSETMAIIQTIRTELALAG